MLCIKKRANEKGGQLARLSIGTHFFVFFSFFSSARKKRKRYPPISFV
jgi:hypothetical protein